MIQIIDNFLSLEYQDYIQSAVEGKIPLFYMAQTVDKPPVSIYKTIHEKDSPQLTHTLVDNNQVTSEYLKLIEPIGIFLFAKVGQVNPSRLFRCRLNLNYRDISYADSDHFRIHTDFSDGTPGFTGLYYVNDSDGDTFFFDQDGTEVVQRVSPKKGTFVLFDNKTLHAGQPPRKSDYRAVINFNWLN